MLRCCESYALVFLLPWLAWAQFWHHLAREWVYPLIGMGDD